MAKQVRKDSKLLFIAHTDNLRGGGELSLIELIKAAKKRGYKPHIVVPGPGEFSRKMDHIRVDCTPIKFFYWGRPYSAIENSTNLTAVKKIADLVTNQNFDCVITNTLMIPWGALAASITDRPHIWITRETLTLHRSHLYDSYEFIEAYSNIVIANSRDNATYLQREIGMKNVKQFYSYVDPQGLRMNSHQLKPRIVNIAAHIRPSKDQFEIVQALGELEKRNQLNIKTVFVGGYSDKDEYFQKIQSSVLQNNLVKKVSFVGFHPRPFELVGPNDIFVRSSKYESLGRTITEAMKLGLICVAADIPSSQEAFELGGGTLYKSGDPENLANVLQRIINEPNNFRGVARQAKKRSLRNLSEKACHQPFFTELEGTINQRNPRRELQYIFPHLVSSLEALKDLEETTAYYKGLAEKRQCDIVNITNSKGWKAVLFARKVLGR